MVSSVVQVIYSLDIGGVEKLAVTIGASLDRSRFRPAICALDGGGVLADELAALGVPYHVLWRKGIELGVLPRLYRCFRREDARIVHTHQFAQLLFSFLPAKLCGARIVHTEHEFFLYRSDPRARRLFRQLIRFCPAMTVVGPEVARYYIEELGVPTERVHVIANGVDLRRFDVARAQARARHGLGEDELVYGIVARLEPEKDHGTLLEAFRVLLAGQRRARLLIAGDGRLRKELESRARSLGIEGRAMFLGAVTDVSGVLAALDVFVLSSVNEGVPLSVVEAMAAGKPVVATDVGGMRLLVKPGSNGMLVPPADPAALAAAMGSLANDPEKRHEMGARGRQLAAESFSLGTMVDRYQQVYESVLDARHVRN
jgi:sugar transferase (PEP-CTERM/EpsH1 system associated)